MDTVRFILAIVLTIAVVVVTNMLFGPTPEPPGEEVAEPGVVDTAADTGMAEAPPPEAVPEAEAAVPTPAAVAAAPEAVEADTVLVSSPLYRYGFTTRGAGVVVAELSRFESFAREGPVDLVPEDAGALLDYRVRVDGRIVDLSRLPFRVEPAGGLELEAGGEAETLRFIYQDPESPFRVEIAYTFRPDAYLVEVQGQITGVRGAPQLLLGMGPTLAIHEADPEEDERALGYAVYSQEDGIESVPLNDVEGEQIQEGPLRWVALKNKYFLAAAIRPAEDGERFFGGVVAEDAPGEHTAELEATLPVGRDGMFAYRLFLGPQDYNRLAALDEGLEDVNPYGWAILRPIIRPLAHVITWAITELHGVLGLGYGWVLILFGFLVRLVLWPLNAKAMRAQLKNMEVQPKLKAIQEKYKDNPEKLQKEMMRLYKEEGFNPLGGCLPMLIPFPVLITLFFVFQNTIEFRGVEFLWLPDLSRPDPYYILPILLGASMFLIQWMSRRSMTTDNPQMKMMMWFMPAFMVVIFLNLASGLNLYYAASNVASVPQQLQIMKERQRMQKRLAQKK